MIQFFKIKYIAIFYLIVPFQRAFVKKYGRLVKCRG